MIHTLLYIALYFLIGLMAEWNFYLVTQKHNRWIIPGWAVIYAVAILALLWPSKKEKDQPL